MDWLVFSYSLPPKSSSSPRVTLWRRLGRLGAISPTSSLYVLPARDECLEAFQWLANEIRDVKGEAVVMRVQEFEGLTDQRLIDLFNMARADEYQELDAQATKVAKTLNARTKSGDHSEIKEALRRLKKRHHEIARVDYFDCPESARVAMRLEKLEHELTPKAGTTRVTHVAIAEYRDRHWVTRPHPHVDRLACVWLIRRFVNPKAIVRYSMNPKPDEIAFDMSEGQFGHRGNLCTFETMLTAFGLDEPALKGMAEVIHEIDLRDGRYTRPETVGIDAILKGWLVGGLSDAELEVHGITLFEGLYSALSNTTWVAPRKKKQ